MDPSSDGRQRVYQLRVQLRHISPPIWRRLLVPAETTIRALHDTLQAAMGWEDCHLHVFTIRGQSYGVPLPGGFGFYTSPDRVRLADCDFRPHERFAYTYDFHGVPVQLAEKVAVSSGGGSLSGRSAALTSA